MIVHSPMFTRLKFPGSTMMLNYAFIQIATFAVIDTAEKIDHQIFYLPEGDAYNIGFA